LKRGLIGGPHLSAGGREGEGRWDWAAWAEREGGPCGEKEKRGKEKRGRPKGERKGVQFGFFSFFQILLNNFSKPF
jgi:hypothetical protein